ncbi:sperm-associated antigen 6-like [Centruroides vittatus]|uniref:sperm-associated antigen 6-like n=1 Tax=Centruroides vittatus TaxID=120091 RepID=UPI00350F34EC
MSSESQHHANIGYKKLFKPVFERYEKSRLYFVQTTCDFSQKAELSDPLREDGIVLLLLPLLLDPSPVIQRLTTVSLGRLANNNADIADDLIKKNVIPLMVDRLLQDKRNTNNTPSPYQLYKRAAAFVLRAIAKHCPEFAQAIVDVEGLNALEICLQESDSMVKESAAYAIANISKHTEELASFVVKKGIFPLLVKCLEVGEINLTRTAAMAILEISKYSGPLKEALNENDCIHTICQLITTSDNRIKLLLIPILIYIVRSSNELAQEVVEKDAVSSVCTMLLEDDRNIVKNAASFLYEMANKSFEVAQSVVNSGAIPIVIKYLQRFKDEVRTPGITFLGQIASHAENLAAAVIENKAVPILCSILTEENCSECTKEATAWALGHIGSHNADHARVVGENNGLVWLLITAHDGRLSADIRMKSKKSLRMILEHCEHQASLEALIQDCPLDIMELVLAQYSKILLYNVRARIGFIMVGALKKIQELKTEGRTEINQYIHTINSCFPEEVVKYYTPSYLQELLTKVEEYKPAKKH